MAKGKNNCGANLGFEADLWRAADALCSNMDAAEYRNFRNFRDITLILMFWSG